MGHWLEKQLKALGVTTVLKDLGQQTLQGQRLALPPAILGKLGNHPSKKTVLIYGHYDVQPVRPLLWPCVTCRMTRIGLTIGWVGDGPVHAC